MQIPLIEQPLRRRQTISRTYQYSFAGTVDSGVISLCFWLKCIMRHVIDGWWRHQMETFSALRPVTRSFNVFFHLRPNKRLSKPSWGWWFETPSRSLWRHCNCPVDIWHYLWQIVFVCLYITPYQHHHCHCANLADDIELIKCQWDMFCRVCE